MEPEVSLPCSPLAIPGRDRDFFSLRHRVQTGSGAPLTSYPMGTGGKATGAPSWPLISI
jgi:hypothetical protein